MRHQFHLGDRVIRIIIIDRKERKEFLRTRVTLQACNSVLSYCSLHSLRSVYFSLLLEVTGPSKHEANVSETAGSDLNFPTEVPLADLHRGNSRERVFNFFYLQEA